MKRIIRFFGIVLLVAVQIVAVCYVTDFVFKKYEKRHVYSYAPLNATSYSLEAMLLNDQGQSVTKKKADKEFRILVFGDSFTYAVTKPEYGFCAVLERKLNALGLDRRFRVVSLGFPSTSFPDYLERFAFWSQAVEYDAVIFNVYLGNDFNDVRETPYNPAAFQEKLAEQCQFGEQYGVYTLIPHQYPFRFMDFIKAKIIFKLQSDNALRRMLFLPDLETLGVLPNAADPRYRSLLPLTPAQMASEMRSSMKPFYPDAMFAYKNDLPWYELFLATAARLSALGKPVLVMLSPPLCAVSPAVGEQSARDLGKEPAAADFALPTRITWELARRVALPQDAIVDLTPCLAGETPDGAGTYSGRDTHWSPEGNAWVGDILARRVAARWFARQDPGQDCPARPVAYEPIPAGLLAPLNETSALAAAIVAGCQGNGASRELPPGRTPATP